MKLSAVLLGLSLLAASSMALGAECTVKIKGNDAMKFDTSEITVSAGCKTITVELEHTGTLPVAAMGHNVVITKAGDMAGVNADGIKAGAAEGYVPKNDARVLTATDMIGGGQTAKASLPGQALRAGGDYVFFCSFPGHAALMKGKLTVID